MITATAADENEIFDNDVELSNTTVVASISTADDQQQVLLGPPPRERQSQRPRMRSRRPQRPRPSMNPDDDTNRQLNNLLPSSFQYLLRDIGFLRLVLNVSVFVGLPTMKQQYPSVLDDFIQVWFGWNYWTWPKRTSDSSIAPLSDSSTRSVSPVDRPLPRRRSIKYGDQSPNQVVELWQWNDDDNVVHNEDSKKKKKKKNDSNETIIFVHGGAWGTGFPAMYSLVALPFLRRKKYNVAIVGYRTYPDANLLQQADDVVDAIAALQREQEQQENDAASKYSYTLIGHSSGSHICSLAMARGMLSSVGDSSTCVVDRFISLAGVFDIREHYRFETVRGLARISPMAPAAAAVDCYDGRVDTSSRRRRRRRQSIIAKWRSSSPLHLVRDMTDRIVATDATTSTTAVDINSDNKNNSDEYFLSSSSTSEDERLTFPNDIMVVHSMDDTTCPYWYSEDFAGALREYNYEKTKETDMSSAPTKVVDLEILTTSGHAELVLELIYGGPTQDLVLDWLENRKQV
mmetsp:Transcript_58221/g.142353  ORF Transcript_58221/g.142353 Transcript_58221/m.142353 type:complete len:517 (-) Transcript_58221:62-1612(-)